MCLVRIPHVICHWKCIGWSVVNQSCRLFAYTSCMGTVSIKHSNVKWRVYDVSQNHWTISTKLSTFFVSLYPCDLLNSITLKHFSDVPARIFWHINSFPVLTTCRTSEEASFLTFPAFTRKMGLWTIQLAKRGDKPKVFRDGSPLKKSDGQRYGTVVNVSSSVQAGSNKLFVKVKL